MSHSNKFVHYPEIDDPLFYQKIYAKKEFNKTRVTHDAMKKTIEEICDAEQFTIQSHQEFLRNYISSETHYNGVLAFWGTGTGKTCGAIQVAEGLKDVVSKLGKKIFIIANKQIQPNFWRELYNPKKEKGELIPGSRQCTGDTYYVSKLEEKDEVRRERKIKNKIKENYEFFGAQSFANYVDIVVKKEYKNVKDFFSNSVIIIDEAHGLTGEAKLKKKAKSSDEKTKKISDRGILTVLHEILGKSEGIKLILLTATPMKDNETELVDLLNLLLINDKREMVDKAKLFPGEDQVDEDYLLEISKGYISYVRGENPITFPKTMEVKPERLDLPEPKIYKPIPIYDEDGTALAEEDLIKHANLIRCPMSIYQYSNYIRTLAKISPTTSTTSKVKKTESIDLIGRQASNIIFPTSDPNKGQHGNSGFSQAFEEYIAPPPKASGVTKTNKLLREKKEIQYKYRDHNKGFLALDRIGQYSKKLETYLKNVISSKGIVYTYSDFVDVGARVIALLLEENGIIRYKPKSIKGSSNLLYKEPGENRHLRCAICGQLKTDNVHVPSDKKHHQFIQATYILFTGKESTHAEEEIEVLNNEDNKYGQLIKIVVGTRVSGIGIDYKRLREVHIIDPWHNNTRLYQAIGRAARHCSHKDLPESERNVTIFKYSSAPPQEFYKYLEELSKIIKEGKLSSIVPISGEEKGLSITFRNLFTETSDEKIYRRIEKKDLFGKKLERILKRSSVDCELGRIANIDAHVNDKDGSRECDYTNCDYKCEGNVDTDVKVNKDTYNLHFAKPQIDRAQKIIYDLYRYHFVIDLSNIIKLVQGKIDIDTEYIYEALDIIVGNPPQTPPIPLIDRYNRPGKLIYAKPYYIFQPEDLVDTAAPLYYRMVPLTIKKEFLNLDAIKEKANKSLTEIQKDLMKKTGKEVSLDISGELDRLSKIKNKYIAYYEFDRLPKNLLASLYEHVMFTETDFQEVLVNYLLKQNKLYYHKVGEQTIYLGHQINNEIRLYENNEWKTVSENNQKIAEMKSTMMAIKAVAPAKKYNKLFGFLSYNDKKKAQEFKLVDKDKQTLKKTKAKHTKKGIKQDISKKSKLRGSICSNQKVVELLEYGKSLGYTETQLKVYTNKKGYKLSKHNREELCKMIEIKLREMDDQDDQLIWFETQN